MGKYLLTHDMMTESIFLNKNKIKAKYDIEFPISRN